MIVPVKLPDNNKYELTRSSLETMWKTNLTDELEEYNLKVKQNIALIKGGGGGVEFLM
jgi:hypothetical protein